MRVPSLRQIQNCGDQIYRSTLDVKLRGETPPIFTPVGLSILSAIAFYLTITPGVLGERGCWDHKPEPPKTSPMSLGFRG
jgi:hypothetical protein